MSKQTVFLRLTRDYINDKRDKRHKTGFNGLSIIKAGAYIVWVPPYVKEARGPRGAVTNLGGYMHLYINERLERISIPHEFVYEFLPEKSEGERVYTEKSAPATACEMMAYYELADYNCDALLAKLHQMGKLNLADIAEGIEALYAQWAEEAE